MSNKFDKETFDVKFERSLKMGSFTKYIHNNLQFKKGSTPKTRTNKVQVFKFQKHNMEDPNGATVEQIAEWVSVAIFKKLKEELDKGYTEKAIFFKNPENNKWMDRKALKTYADANELTEEDIENLEHELQTTKFLNYNCNFRLNQKYLDRWNVGLRMEELTEVKCGALYFYYSCDNRVSESIKLETDENDEFTGEKTKVKTKTNQYDLRVYLPMKARESLKNANL